MPKTYRWYREARLNKLRRVIESRVKVGVLPIPSYGLIGRDSLRRKPNYTLDSSGFERYVDVFFDDDYAVGCLRGIVSFNPNTGATRRDRPLQSMGFSDIEISVLDAGFEDLVSPSFSEYLECYAFGQHILEDFCMTLNTKCHFKLKFVR